MNLFAFVPAGFENITNDYSGQVSLDIGRKHIGNTDIVYNERENLITLSKQAQDIIIKSLNGNLTDLGKKKIFKEIQQPIKTNTNPKEKYITTDKEAISSYFDINKLHLIVYVPYSYLKKKSINYEFPQYHPIPKNQDLGIISNLDINYNQIGAREYNSISADGSFSSRKLSLQYDMGSQVKHYTNDLYLQYIGKKYIYQTGFIDLPLKESLLSSKSFWGVAVYNSEKLINPEFYSAYKIPLTLVLDRDYYVEISSQGKTLYRGTLQYGTNLINTSRFPYGTYNITITKRDLISGRTTEENQIFSKDTSKYNSLYSGFQLFAGIQQQYFETPKFKQSKENNQFFKIQKGFKALKGELDFYYANSMRNNYIGTEYDYIYNNIFDYSIDIEASDKKDFFASSSAYYNTLNSTFGLWTSTRYEPSNKANDNNGKKESTINFSFATLFHNWNINTSINYKSNGTKTISGSMSQNLLQNSGSTDLIIRISASHKNYTSNKSSENQAAVSLDILFDHNSLETGMRIDHDIDENYTAINPFIEFNNDHLSISQSIQAALQKSEISNNRRIKGETDAELYSEFGEINASLNTDYKNNKININRKQIGLNTTIIGTLKGITLTNQNALSGYIINTPYINQQSTNDSKEFGINGEVYPHNKTVFIQKRPYQYHSIYASSPGINYQLEKDEFKSFLYPYNIHSINLKVRKACTVTFKLISKKQKNKNILNSNEDPKLYELIGYPEYYFTTNDTTEAYLPEGTKLNFINIKDPQDKCNTNKFVQCKSEFNDLGTISLKSCAH